uniref:SCP domain-containing protein n=1 Tax=Parastrongyloides trichosuri TaxID=131310 RepID=A0A0N4Z578_PARTI
MQFFIIIATVATVLNNCYGEIDKKSFIAEVYKKSNCLRAAHDAPAMKVDSALEAQAQKYADKLLSDGKGLVHSKSGGKYGENLAWGSSDKVGNIAADGWYDEVKDYNFGRPGFGMKTGHFTQLVWKASTSVGCGVASGKNGIFTVCQYKPPGNFGNKYKENVVKSKSGKPKC